MTDSAFEKFKNPPIKEAVFILNLSNSISPEKIKMLAKSEIFRTKYPFYKSSIQNSLTIDTRKDIHTSLEKLLDGLIFQTSREKPEWVLQVKRNSILLHKIGNYISWENILKEFESILPAIQCEFPNIQLKDVGIRYINNIPIPSVDLLYTWFNLLPSTKGDVPIDFNKFLFQIGIKKDDMTGLIVESTVLAKSLLNFVLDIRINKTLPNVNLEMEVLHPHLTEVRDFKNQTFFSIISDNLKMTFR